MSFSSQNGDELRRHRALADPSRARILAELAGGDALDARELSHRVGLHVNTVRVHLNALAEAGLVESETLPPRGRGRPRVVHRATGAVGDDGGSRRYRLLAEILTTLVARLDRDAKGQLAEIGETWGRYLVEAPPPFASPSEEEAVRGMLELLAEIGFQPQLDERAGDDLRVLMRPCPFLELAKEHRDVICPIHLGLMRGALAGLGAELEATELEPFAQPNLCVAHLARRRAA